MVQNVLFWSRTCFCIMWYSTTEPRSAVDPAGRGAGVGKQSMTQIVGWCSFRQGRRHKIYDLWVSTGPDSHVELKRDHIWNCPKEFLDEFQGHHIIQAVARPRQTWKNCPDCSEHPSDWIVHCDSSGRWLFQCESCGTWFNYNTCSIVSSTCRRIE